MKSCGIDSINTDIHSLLEETRPYFSDQRLKCFDWAQFRNLPSTLIPPEKGKVDLSRVRGTSHPNYHGLSWLELLPTNPDDYVHLDYWQRFRHEGNMKRGWSCLHAMRRNPDYYLDSTKKDHWSFYKVLDSYYIAQGNHRTVMARFLLSLNGLPEVIRGVSVREIHLPLLKRLSLRFLANR